MDREGGSIETIDPCRDRCSRHTRILAAAIDGGQARLLIEPRRSSPRGWASTGMGREGRSKPSTPAETVVQDTREFWRQRSTEGKPGCSSSRVDRRHGAGHRRAWGGRVDRNHRPLPRPLFKTHANFGGSDRRRASQAAHRAASIVATGLGIDGHGEGGSIETIDPCRDRCSRHTRILAAAPHAARTRWHRRKRRCGPHAGGRTRSAAFSRLTPSKTVVGFNQKTEARKRNTTQRPVP